VYISNLTKSNIEYRILVDVPMANFQTTFAAFGTIDADREDLQAERDIREGHYQTLTTIESIWDTQYGMSSAALMELLGSGAIKPGETQDSNLESGAIVEFWVKDRLVADFRLIEKSCALVLVEEDGRYWVEVESKVEEPPNTRRDRPR
jgi:hypothetical protein